MSCVPRTSALLPRNTTITARMSGPFSLWAPANTHNPPVAWVLHF